MATQLKTIRRRGERELRTTCDATQAQHYEQVNRSEMQRNPLNYKKRKFVQRKTKKSFKKPDIATTCYLITAKTSHIR